jgi:hypothetical protein
MRNARSLYFRVALFGTLLALAGLLLPVVGTQTAKASVPLIGLQTPIKITKLIYPTFGNPAIKKKGDSFTLEFDPRDRNAHWTVPNPPTCIRTTGQNLITVSIWSRYKFPNIAYLLTCTTSQSVAT